MRKVWSGLGAVALALVGYAWATDFISMQGERTLYTAQCLKGQWVGDRCTGEMAAAERVRYKALKQRGEVLFWNVGAVDISGRLGPCQVRDGRNWVCEPNADARRSITLALSEGHPKANNAGITRPAHCISKWKWLSLKAEGRSVASSS
jgi:hypothetical protein